MTQAHYRRIDHPALDVPPSTSIPAASLPALAHLAQRLLFARARGEKPCQSVLSLAELRPLGLTLADCRDLIHRGLVTVLPLPSGEGRGEGGSGATGADHQTKRARKVAGTVPVPSARTSSSSPSGRGRGEGGLKASAVGPQTKRPRKGRKVAGTVREPSARKGRGKAKSPSPSGRGQGEGVSRTAPRSISKPPDIGPRSLIHLTDAGLALITKHAQYSREPSPSGRGQGEGASNATGSTSQVGAAEPQSSVSPSVAPPLLPSVSPTPLLPHYDIDLRELSVAGKVILRLRLQAHNLTAVLTALQLACWPPRVVKPLNGSRGGNDPHHLANVALGLKAHQALIDFSTDNGAICWAWRPRREESTSFPARRPTPNYRRRSTDGPSSIPRRPENLD